MTNTSNDKLTLAQIEHFSKQYADNESAIVNGSFIKQLADTMRENEKLMTVLHRVNNIGVFDSDKTRMMVMGALNPNKDSATNE